MRSRKHSPPRKINPVQLEIFKSLFHAIAEEMGATLKRTAFSPNIKERRDYSCAIFDDRGDMVAQGDHMPVHLGSMPLSVKAAIENREIGPGDMVILNDPYKGGTHLPDLTLVSGVFSQRKLLFYVASRAHQSDIGGMSPGSMPLAEEIYQEGLRIPPVKVVTSGKINRDVWDMVLANVRTPDEREGDLAAMLGANSTGERRLMEIIAPEGTVVNARPPAAVCGGNVETSQRIVDVLYRCLAAALPDRIPAASQGTMNNFTFGGVDPRTKQSVAYYETVCGGMGARPTMNGLSGVHTHMTNSMNTPAEALEHAYPIRLLRYCLRPGSGGFGKWPGGDA